MSHPYIEYEGSEEWMLVESVVDKLVENKDITLLTNKTYIIGYFCKNLCEKEKGGKDMRDDR